MMDNLFPGNGGRNREVNLARKIDMFYRWEVEKSVVNMNPIPQTINRENVNISWCNVPGVVMENELLQGM